MSKRSRSRKAPKGDLSFCFEVNFVPPGALRFSQIDTPYSVVVDLCPDHAGQFLYQVGEVFLKLSKEKRESFDNCILLFADHLLKNPQEHMKYDLHEDADNYLSYLADKKDDDGQELLFSAVLDEKSTRH